MAPAVVVVNAGAVESLDGEPGNWTMKPVIGPVSKDDLRNIVAQVMDASVRSPMSVRVRESPPGYMDLNDPLIGLFYDAAALDSHWVKVVKEAVPVHSIIGSKYLSYTMIHHDWQNTGRIRKVAYLFQESGLWCQDFERLWEQKKQNLTAIEVTAVYCTSEKGERKKKSYRSAADLLLAIFAELLSIQDFNQQPPKAAKDFIDTAVREKKTRPDIGICLVDDGTVPNAENIYKYIRLAEELKAKLSPTVTTAEGDGQCIDRATRAFEECLVPVQKLAFPAFVGDNRLLKAMLIIKSRVARENQAWQNRDMLELVENPKAPDMDDLPFNTNSNAFKEVSYLCYVGARQYLEAHAESLLLGPPVPDQGIFIRSEKGDHMMLKRTGVLSTLRLRGGVLIAQGEGETSLVVKLGPAPEITSLGSALCQPAERFLQVQREASILARVGRFDLLPTLVCAGTLEEPVPSYLQAMIGAPVVVSRLLGEPLVKGEEVPVLAEDELYFLGADLLDTLIHIWNCGVQHNDLHPGQVGSLAPGASSEYRYYLYDFGAASHSDEDIKVPTNLQWGSLRSIRDGAGSMLGDLESLVYVLCAYAGVALPWGGAAAEDDIFMCITRRVEMLVSPQTAAPLCQLPSKLRLFAQMALKIVNRGVVQWTSLVAWVQILRREGQSRKQPVKQASVPQPTTGSAGPVPVPPKAQWRTHDRQITAVPQSVYGISQSLAASDGIVGM